jgi:hypothetical protein
MRAGVPGGSPPPPTIEIDPAAREYIAARGGAVTLRSSRRNGCCGGTAFVPVAEAESPRDPAAYRSVEVDGITVFIEANVTGGPEPLMIGLDTLWRWGRLSVEGSAIWMWTAGNGGRVHESTTPNPRN